MPSPTTITIFSRLLEILKTVLTALGILNRVDENLTALAKHQLVTEQKIDAEALAAKVWRIAQTEMLEEILRRLTTGPGEDDDPAGQAAVDQETEALEKSLDHLASDVEAQK